MPDSKLQPKPERHFALLGYLSAFLLICLLWRMDFLALLGSMKLPISGIAAALAGALWMDVLLALVMLVLLLGTDRLGKTKRVVSHVLLLLGFAWVAIARIADGAYFYYSGNHVDRIALEHLQGDAFGMRLDSRITVYLILAALVATLALCLLLLAARVLRRMEKTEILRLVLAPLVGLCFSSWFFSLFSDATFGRDRETRSRLRVLQAAPEIAIPLLALSSGEEAVYRDRSFLLHPVVKKKLRKFGLKIDESKKYPLIKQTVFEKPHPFARTEHWLSKPNVIIIFFESFSAELTSVYSQRYPGLTPNLEDFAKVSLVVLDFFNSSTPTVTALTSSHASILPVTNTMTWFEKENNSGQTKLHALPAILREHGWQTKHVHSLENSFVHTGKAMARLGFDEVIDGTGIGKRIGERRANWGFSDHQIFRYVVKDLQERERRSPFLLSVATVDSHAPFMPSREAPAYGDGSMPILTSIHGADHAFGIFWHWFKSSGYYTNTIVVALADHAMFPGKENAEARPDEDLGGRYYDRCFFGIYDPRHEMPRRMGIVSSQLDLAPTLLHLLDMNVRNHFEGLSIFGMRKQFPAVLGMHEYLFCIYQEVDGKPKLDNFTLEDIEGNCDSTQFDPSTSVLNRCEYLHFYRWKRALNASNRIWR